jgi:hypothetical protein
MEKIKQLQKWIPELYMIASVIFYWISTSNVLNPVALFLLVVLTTLFIWKNEVLGIVISSLFLGLSLFMVLALISELNDFPTFGQNAKTMLLIGAIWLILNISLSIIMIVKWGRQASLSQATITIEATT